MNAEELRAEIERLQSLLKNAENAEFVARVIETGHPVSHYIPSEVMGEACNNCGGEGRLEQGHGSGKWVRCQVCKGTGAK